jgi:hypothetical protein
VAIILAIIDLSTIVKLLGKFGFEKNCVRAFDRKPQLGLANPSGFAKYFSVVNFFYRAKFIV